MPIVHIELLEGRPASVKTELMTQVTNAVVASLGVDIGQVRVILSEVSPEHWAVGGKTKAESARLRLQEEH